jgi:hypothetical protein
MTTRAGALLRATIVPGQARNKIQSVRFGGAVRDEPAGSLAKLEGVLAGASIDQAPARIEDFFAQNDGALPGVEPDELFMVLNLAFMKVRRTTSTAPDPAAWKKGPPKA